MPPIRILAITTLFLLSSVVRAEPQDSSEPRLEVKYNAAGPLYPKYAEHALEIEYGFHRLFRPYVRAPLILREFEHYGILCDCATGKGRETGFHLQAGAKARPLPFRFTRGFEVGLYYRYANLDSRHRDIDETGYSEVQDIEAQALGYAFSWNVNLFRRLTLEPFVQSDYGRYWIKDHRRPDPALSGHSEYRHPWDDETRIGLNLGLLL